VAVAAVAGVLVLAAVAVLEDLELERDYQSPPELFIRLPLVLAALLEVQVAAQAVLILFSVPLFLLVAVEVVVKEILLEQMADLAVEEVKMEMEGQEIRQQQTLRRAITAVMVLDHLSMEEEVAAAQQVLDKTQLTKAVTVVLALQAIYLEHL
jgi:hypothetical protein